MGCIGAWVLRRLLDRGDSVVATDLSADPVRPRLLLSEDEIARIDWRQLDVTNTKAVADKSNITPESDLTSYDRFD